MEKSRRPARLALTLLAPLLLLIAVRATCYQRVPSRDRTVTAPTTCAEWRVPAGR
jgi:hypothetical protein